MITQVSIPASVSQFLFTDDDMTYVVDPVTSKSCKVFQVMIDNSLNSTAGYLELYDVASGDVTIGVTAASVVVMVPANTIITQRFFTQQTPGLLFSTALSAAFFLTAAGTSPCAPTFDVVVSIRYA